MNKIKFVTNPTSEDFLSFYATHTDLPKEIVQKLDNSNVRIELLNYPLYTFCVFYIPEYKQKTRTISSVELNIVFNRNLSEIVVFAYDTHDFFVRYADSLSKIQDAKFEVFLEKLLDVVIEDENKIIDHILLDTKNLKSESLFMLESRHVLDHLAQNLVNISELRLVIQNQDKLLTRLEETIKNFVDAPVKFKRSFIVDELNYAQDFSHSLLETINTKYQVKMSDSLYAYTKYTFIFFLFGSVVEAISLYNWDANPIKLVFWLAGLLTLLGTLIMFRKF